MLENIDIVGEGLLEEDDESADLDEESAAELAVSKKLSKDSGCSHSSHSFPCKAGVRTTLAIRNSGYQPSSLQDRAPLTRSTARSHQQVAVDGKCPSPPCGPCAAC